MKLYSLILVALMGVVGVLVIGCNKAPAVVAVGGDASDALDMAGDVTAVDAAADVTPAADVTATDAAVDATPTVDAAIDADCVDVCPDTAG